MVANAAAPATLVRLDGLRSKRQFNHHIAELLLHATNPDRAAIRVISNAQTMSVPRATAIPLAVRASGATTVLTHECQASEEEILANVTHLIERTATSSGQTGPPELGGHILSFLRLRPVSMLQVRALGASSTGEDVSRCTPAFSLSPSGNNCAYREDSNVRPYHTPSLKRRTF